MSRKPQRLARKLIYDHALLNVYEDRVQYPAGLLVERHAFLDFKNPGVAILMHNENNEILLAHVFRYILDSVEWEIPAGTTHAGEDALETARREALEESGYEAVDLKHLYDYYPSSGIANQVFKIYTCRAGSKIADFDRSEIAAVKWFKHAEIWGMIRRNEIKDGFSLTALLLFLTSAPSSDDGR